MSETHKITITGPEETTQPVTTLPTQNGHHVPYKMDNNNDSKSEQDTPLRRDRPHSLEKHQSRTFTYLDAGFILKGVATYIFDVVTDVLACIRYFAKGDYWWASLTLVFILTGSVAVQAASFRWFVNDYSQKTRKPVQRCCRKAVDWLVWIIVHMLQLATINRYLWCLYYGWKSRKSRESHKKYYIWKVYEQRDLTMLRLIESFLEAGPQLVLQLYIMLHLYLSQVPQFYWITALSAISSLLSLSWALEAYHKALRESLEDKQDITYCGVGFRFVWRVSMITSRVSAMALFAIHFKWLIFPVVLCHWVLMTTWLIHQKTEFCETPTEEKLFCCVIAVVHIFCFFNMKEGRTRLRAAIYYILVFFENSIMAVLWYYFSGMYIHDSYGIIALSFVWGGYFIGIITMIMYYVCFHPNRSRDATSCDTSQQTTEQEQVDGSLFQDVPDGVRGHRRGHNLFTRSGRRYLYWQQEDGNSQETQHLQSENVAQNGGDVQNAASNETSV